MPATSTRWQTPCELRVPEIGMDPGCECNERDVLNALLDALELAGLAGGCRRIVVMPPKMSLGFIERRGYSRISERCAGGWIEKTLV